MGKYFGTDGIRGVANVGLTPEIAYKVGSFLANYYTKEGKKAKIVIGKDTRLSSSLLESALTTGITAHGGDAYQLSYTSTPCLAYSAMHNGFDCGIMISASHNPYYDNGIKVFATNGLKLDAKVEALIEEYIDNPSGIEKVSHEKIGNVFQYSEGVNAYFNWLDETFKYDLSHLNIVLDLANGSNCYTAKEVLSRKGANLFVINDEPNGLNINTNCGSTHLEMLIDYIKDGDYDIGFAFDGDADRVLVIDSEGNVVDGDKIMYLLSKHLMKHGQLKDETLVTTVMSNIGLYKALDRANVKYDVVAVGDKYVVESMVKNGYNLGGEQSGHIINSNHSLFGDGLKTAMNILEVMVENDLGIDELVEDVKIYPQLLVNVKVTDKTIVLNDEVINAKIDEIKNTLGNDGRILVRPSGTEPLIRVMVEASTDEICHDLVYSVIDLIKEKGYAK